MKYLLLNLFLIVGIASAKDYKKCKELFINEFHNILSQDQGIIDAQLTMTALKLANKVLERKGLSSQTIESYTNSIIGNKTLDRLRSKSTIQNSVLSMMNKYRSNVKYIDSSLVLENLKVVEKMSDGDISVLMSGLQEAWKGK